LAEVTVLVVGAVPATESAVSVAALLAGTWVTALHRAIATVFTEKNLTTTLAAA